MNLVIGAIMICFTGMYVGKYDMDFLGIKCTWYYQISRLITEGEQTVIGETRGQTHGKNSLFLKHITRNFMRTASVTQF